MPRVSVIIPTYNDARFLGEAIQGVFDQTYGDFEIVVVDDGSTDDPEAVVARWSDPRLRCLHQENQGLPSARNAGLRASSGEYVAFLDADDAFLPHKLAAQVTYLQGHPEIGLVAGGWVSVNEWGEPFREARPWEHKPALDLETVLTDCPLMVHCLLVRRAALDRVGHYDPEIRWQEDRDLYVRLVLDGCRMAWQEEIVCVRRWHAGNMSRDVRKMHEHTLRGLDKLYARGDLSAQLLGVEALALKDVVYAHAYARSAAHFYMAGLSHEAEPCVQQAVALDARWLEGQPPRIIGYVVHAGVDSPLMGNRQRFFADLRRSFPALVHDGGRWVRQLASQYYMGRVFNARGSECRAAMRNDLVRGLLYEPSWLWNVGVWSLALDAFLGQRVSGWARTTARKVKALRPQRSGPAGAKD